MGKTEDEEGLPSIALDAQGTTAEAGNRNGCCLGLIRVLKLVNFRCVSVLLLGLAVMLSVVFWLPFFHFEDHKDLDLDYAGHDIVASFMLREPSLFLEEHMWQLEGDIFDEMSFLSTKVEIMSLKSSGGPNTTKVVFAVEADETTQSLIRASFVSLITHQSFLRLASSLFAMPFSFQVLKFKGGITVSPEQKAFLFQNVQILFNFTLNSSIDEILDNFDELRGQLRIGLDLTPYENLYIRLTNLRGSSVSTPTTVQSQVLLAVGINPSKARLKQLAQTITGSHAKNLGLNNTVFGRVKQVQLSSILQHSLGSDRNSPSPSPSPLPPPHHHHHTTHLAPSHSLSPSRHSRESTTGTPAPAPAPGKHSPAARPPCPFRYNHRFPWKHNKHSHSAPSATPVHAPAAAPVPPKHTNSPVPTARPPSVAYARPPNVMSMVSSMPSPSSAGTFSYIWGLPVFLLITLLL